MDFSFTWEIMEIASNQNIRLVALIFAVGIGLPVVFLVVRFLVLAAIHDFRSWREERAVKAIKASRAKGSKSND